MRCLRVGRSTLPLAATFGLTLTLTAAALAFAPEAASAQRMDLALSRLRVPSADPTPEMPNPACMADTGAFHRDFCQDDAAWRSLATQFAGGLIPPMLTPARTRGPRSFYFGIDTSITGIDASSGYWHSGTEGTGSGGSSVADMNRQVDGVLAWTRLSVRKALPFGFELGTNLGYLVNTSYWALGVEIRWALLEGWLTRDWYVPDIAVRGAVQTLVGDPEFNMTVATVDLTISNSIVIGDQFELSPFLAGQLSWTFADTELVDLTPGISAFNTCNPDPTTPTGPDPGGGRGIACRGTGTDYNHNAVFASIRTMRPRLIFGLQGRFEVFTVTGSFSFDAVAPYETDAALPRTIVEQSTGMLRAVNDRQWRLDIGVGLSY